MSTLNLKLCLVTLFRRIQNSTLWHRNILIILLRSLLLKSRSQEASKSAASYFIGSSLTSSSSHGACASSTSRTWSNRRSSILPKCLSKPRMDAMLLCLRPCKRDYSKPMMSIGKSYGSMRPCSPNHLMRSTSGVDENRTSPYHVSLSVQSTQLFLLQLVKDLVSSASHYMTRQ